MRDFLLLTITVPFPFDIEKGCQQRQPPMLSPHPCVRQSLTSHTPSPAVPWSCSLTFLSSHQLQYKTQNHTHKTQCLPVFCSYVTYDLLHPNRAVTWISTVDFWIPTWINRGSFSFSLLYLKLEMQILRLLPSASVNIQASSDLKLTDL